MAAIWSGSITFGLVSIPVKLETAQRSKELGFNLLHKECQQRVNQRYYCGTCDAYVDRSDLVKGYEYEKDHYVILQPEDFSQAEGEASRNMEVIGFIEGSRIRAVHLNRTYYLLPEEGSEKGYVLLLRAMQETVTMAVIRFVMRSKEYIGAVGSTEQGLLLHILFHQGEFQHLEEIVHLPDVKLSEKELGLARQIIENLSEEFSEDMLVDQYRQRLLEVIRQKVDGEPTVVAEPKKPAKVVDLMEALKRSLEATGQKKPAARAGAQEPAARTKKERRKRA